MRTTLWMSPTEGFALSLHFDHSQQNHIPTADESSVPELEVDQTVPPRPEACEQSQTSKITATIEGNRPRCWARNCLDETASQMA